jgi:hypothetical protein
VARSASDYQRRELKKAAEANFYSGTGIRGSAKPGYEKNQPSGLSDADSIRSWSERASKNSGDRKYDAGRYRESGPFEKSP